MTPEQTHAWIKALGGTKFLLTVGAGIVDTALLILGCLPASDYVILTMGTVAAYITGHVVQTVKTPQ